MRVALFLGGYTPANSGTYTFERELLHAIADFKNSSNHEFFIFGWSQDIPPEIFSVPHIHFDRNVKNPKSNLSFKIAKFFHGKISKYIDQKHIFQFQIFVKNLIFNNDSNVLKKIINYKIEIAWFLSLDCPTMEVPYIATAFDVQHRLQPYFPEVSTRGKWINRETYFSETLKRATFIVTGTTVGQREIEKFYNIYSDKIRVIPFATPRFALEACPCANKEVIFKKYNISQEYLFYPAQFWPHKNHVGLLLALKCLREKYDIHFSIVFAGSDKGNLSFVRQKVDELCLSEQVKFTGFISSEDLILLYQNAFALTFASLFGPDNLPPLEAFALGCPVIASKVSGAEEQLGDAAILVNPKEPEAMAEAIRALKENSGLRQTLIQRGFQRAKQWTGKDYIREICSILDEFAPIRHCWSNSEVFNSDV
jgi:glycosyltransferase involved in cell wall biosynthesis